MAFNLSPVTFQFNAIQILESNVHQIAATLDFAVKYLDGTPSGLLVFQDELDDDGYEIFHHIPLGWFLTFDSDGVPSFVDLFGYGEMVTYE